MTKFKAQTQSFFIRHNEIPHGEKVTYANFICNIRSLKKESHRVQCTLGDDQLDCEEDPSSLAAGLFDINIHVNSTISDAHLGARYSTADIENYNLNNPMKTFWYMRISTTHIPDEVMTEYALHEKIHNDHVYVEIRKDMYGLKEAGLIAFQRLIKNLAPHDYSTMRYTPGM